MDYLPGAKDLTPQAAASFDVDPLEAGRIVWLDALTVNVDRTTHSSNLMVWPRCAPPGRGGPTRSHAGHDPPRTSGHSPA
ncbi:hypothetical protein GCM10023084_58550 [Streptomyces lacrimifluminis]|uniref:Uncharacterized protein n=1 Tax=Streptomyces lacrimifluminis TaxID=1500077 RepID=A0A917P3M0_9ACTN|nr:hypothetical protein GCM10012282_61050 [Streptomyces lacrimifluminis]